MDGLRVSEDNKSVTASVLHKKPKTSFRRLVFPTLALAIATGWWVPEFYDWTGADQSRPAPIVGWIAIGIVVLDAIAIAWLVWSHFSNRSRSENKHLEQFSTKQILLTTTSVALLLVLSRWVDADWIAYLIHAIVWCVAIGLSIRTPTLRFWLLSLFLCQLLPFLWLLRTGRAISIGVVILWMLSSLPSILPTLCLSAMTQRHFDQLQWAATMMTSLELVVGLWFVARGPKCAIGFCLVVFTISLFGSFVLHALMRA